jgi:hypothetical protein
MAYRTLNNLAGWIVFAVAAIVYFFSAEPTGSLWDCGEFVSGAYKLQVVHPPGAPIFLLIGRLFAWVGAMFTDEKTNNIAYAVNMLSGLSTAAAAMFVAWTTGLLAKLALVGRENEPDSGQSLAIAGSTLVAGLTTAFCTSIWFSAVEGEVYAMSTMFTALVFWAMIKWYSLPESPQNDRWIVFALYAAGISIGVHLLSLLTFPALAMFYYHKKSAKPTLLGAFVAGAIGTVMILLIQILIIAGIPGLWSRLEMLMVNGLGLPFHSGLIPLLLIFGGAIWFGLRRAQQTGNGLLQKLVVSLAVIIIAYLAYGTVIIRANANPPINMNDPSDAMRMLPYLNREQYGDRPFLRGPNFDAKPAETTIAERSNRVGDHYEVTDHKIDYDYANKDLTLFPRMQDYSQGRPDIYRQWIDKKTGAITLGDNLEFFFKYQTMWMYWRYLMWNFTGRQNGDQGYYSWDITSGNWLTGIDSYDGARLGNRAELTDTMRSNQANNKYYGIPFLLGLIGLFWQAKRRSKDFLGVLGLFFITGMGIVLYTNEPPNEPRERDYALAASFFTYAIWVGLAIPAIYSLFADKLKFGGIPAAAIVTVLGLSAPFLMGTQNFDDHSRAKHFASRDYAANFLNSCAKDAIIFTYGDNDTYPLWYCQEVENIRPDIRVVNLSLIAVDWYIEQLRRKVNDSDPIKLSITTDKIRGFKRIQIPFYNPAGQEAPDTPMSLADVVKHLSGDNKLPAQSGRAFDTYLPTRKIFIPINKERMYKSGVITEKDTAVVPAIAFSLGDKTNYILKDDLAVLDIINSNWPERPIYFAVTVQPDKILGLNDYLQLEGMGLRLVPLKNASDRRFSVMGSGRVNTDLAYKNIMENFKWGGFDKDRLFVDKSYQPSVQTMRVLFIRTASELLRQGDKDRAVKLVDKFFEGFPPNNFPWDFNHSFLINIYIQAGANDKAADKIRPYAAEMAANLKYYKSLGGDVDRGYAQDQQFAMRTAQDLIRMATEIKNDGLKKELEDLFSPFGVAAPKVPAFPNIPN